MSRTFKIKKFQTIQHETDSKCIYLENCKSLPIIPLKNGVLFPQNSLPLGDLEGLLRAQDLKAAERGTLRVGILTDLSAEGDKSPQWASVGTEAIISNILKLPDGQKGFVVKARSRFLVREIESARTGYVGNITFVDDIPSKKSTRWTATIKALKSSIDRILKFNGGVSEETKAILTTSDDVALILDLIAPYLSISLAEKLALLGDFDVRSRMRKILGWLNKESELLKLSQEIHEEVSGDLHETDRRNYLREQIRAIRRELGEMEGSALEVEELEEIFEKMALPKLAKEAASEELERMNITGAGSPEYIISHNYVTLLRDLPWNEEKPKNRTLAKAREFLDDAHYGLGKIKEKILDYLAVLVHKKGEVGEILLLVGPPGVGKTSLAKSIAEALDRKFARIALGGVRDEAEIRGHRRTYIGAMPGKILQAIKQTKSKHSVILLDEIDKIGEDGKGAVAAALLEVLDQEQNKNFVDHYLAIPFDLSSIIFVATANNVDKIPGPLLDRMEIIELSSYTGVEKKEIARRHIIPSIRKELSLVADQLKIPDRTLGQVIDGYTREAGVRQLRRELTAIARKVVKDVVEKKSKKTAPISLQNLTEWLGQPKFLPEPLDAELAPGVSIGLAYTDVGGDIMYIEASAAKHSGQRHRLNLTGSLGKVMKESAEAVLTYLLSHSASLGIDPRLVEESALHIHFPDGATPKDGPSAGVAILCAVAGCFLNRSIPANLAMTGEITLRGQVLAVGGIREKVIAAHRYGKKRVLIPKANEFELGDIPREVLDDMEIVLISTMEEALMSAELIPWRLSPQKTIKSRSSRETEHTL